MTTMMAKMAMGLRMMVVGVDNFGVRGWEKLNWNQRLEENILDVFLYYYLPSPNLVVKNDTETDGHGSYCCCF